MFGSGRVQRTVVLRNTRVGSMNYRMPLSTKKRIVRPQLSGACFVDTNAQGPKKGSIVDYCSRENDTNPRATPDSAL